MDYETLQAHFKYKKRRGRMFSDTSSLSGDPLGARTQDPNIKSVVLYLLS
jgi:hypothetical protein